MSRSDRKASRSRGTSTEHDPAPEAQEGDSAYAPGCAGAIIVVLLAGMALAALVLFYYWVVLFS